MRIALVFAVILLPPLNAVAVTPEWALKNTQRLEGDVLTVVCNGIGPSITLARSDAKAACILSASDFLNTKVEVKSLSVETEKSVGFHQTVQSDKTVKNLICKPEQDEVQQDGQSFTLWLKCRFDLKSVVVDAQPTPAKSSDEEPNYSEVRNKNTDSVKSIRQADRKTLAISSIPQCESILITGAKSRIQSCKSNPVIVMLEDGDEEAIIRANGFIPKSIPLKNQEKNYVSVQVVLDR